MRNKIRYTLGKYKNKIRYTALSKQHERLRKKAALAAVETQRLMDRDKWSYERKLIARIDGIRLRLFPESHNGIKYCVYVRSAVLSDATWFNWYIDDREMCLDCDNSWAVGDLLDLLYYRAKTEPKVAKYINLLLNLENEAPFWQLPHYIYRIR